MEQLKVKIAGEIALSADPGNAMKDHLFFLGKEKLVGPKEKPVCA